MAYEKVKQRKKRTSRFDWQALITRQLQSGIPVAQFCREHQLSASAFYHNRIKLFPELSPQPKSFISAQVIPSTVPMLTPVDGYFTLTYSGVELSIPSLTSPQTIVQLMREMAR
jgi:hypothetical protein